MILIPCIDLKDGQCVRLEKGDFNRQKIYEKDPLKQAIKMEKAGLDWIHVIDLDGAKGDGKDNRTIIQKIRENTSLKIQLGGGLRDVRILKNYDDLGIDRMILGTRALEDFDFAVEAHQKYGDKIVISIDCEGEEIRTRGWVKNTKLSIFSYIKKMMKEKINHLIYTDINRDGMRTGPNIKVLKKIKKSYNGNIIAAGGISSIDDVYQLKNLDLYGVITGRAYYEGDITMDEIMKFNGVSNG